MHEIIIKNKYFLVFFSENKNYNLTLNHEISKIVFVSLKSF